MTREKMQAELTVLQVRAMVSGLGKEFEERFWQEVRDTEHCQLTQCDPCKEALLDMKQWLYDHTGLK